MESSTGPKLWHHMPCTVDRHEAQCVFIVDHTSTILGAPRLEGELGAKEERLLAEEFWTRRGRIEKPGAPCCCLLEADFADRLASSFIAN